MIQEMLTTHMPWLRGAKTKELLKVDTMNVLADKGYHTGDQIQQCIENNITTYVSPKHRQPKISDCIQYRCLPTTRNQIPTPVRRKYIANKQHWYQHSEKRHKEDTGTSSGDM